MANCVICGAEYKAKRVTSRYCSVKCKQTSYRNKDSVTTKPRPVTVTNNIKAAELPACVPDVIRNRYARGESDYTIVIDRLCMLTLDELKGLGVWIPCWRYAADKEVRA